MVVFSGLIEMLNEKTYYICQRIFFTGGVVTLRLYGEV